MREEELPKFLKRKLNAVLKDIVKFEKRFDIVR